MSKITTLTSMQNDMSDSDVIIKKKELLTRLKKEEDRYHACYEDTIKFASMAKGAKEENLLYQKILETNEIKHKELVNRIKSLENELAIYKSKENKPIKELNVKVCQKSANDFEKDVEEQYKKTEKERLEKLKKTLEDRFIVK